MSDYDRAAELAAIRERAAVDSVQSGCGCAACRAKQDRRVLLARLDALEDIEAERDAIAQAADSMATAFNAAFERIAEQRDGDRRVLIDVCIYLERLPARTPMIDRLITAITARLGPRSSRIDELP